MGEYLKYLDRAKEIVRSLCPRVGYSKRNRISTGELVYLLVSPPPALGAMKKMFQGERPTEAERNEFSTWIDAAMQPQEFGEISDYCCDKGVDETSRRAVLILEAWTAHGYFDAEKALYIV